MQLTFGEHTGLTSPLELVLAIEEKNEFDFRFTNEPKCGSIKLGELNTWEKAMFQAFVYCRAHVDARAEELEGQGEPSLEDIVVWEWGKTLLNLFLTTVTSRFIEHLHTQGEHFHRLGRSASYDLCSPYGVYLNPDEDGEKETLASARSGDLGPPPCEDGASGSSNAWTRSGRRLDS